MSSRQLVIKTVEVAEQKKAHQVIVLNLKKTSTITDYFVICSGNSSAHMKAIAQGLEKRLSENDMVLVNPKHFRDERWILLDFGSIVVHIFSEEARKYYQLERLWIDAQRESFSRVIQAGLDESKKDNDFTFSRIS